MEFSPMDAEIVIASEEDLSSIEHFTARLRSAGVENFSCSIDGEVISFSNSVGKAIAKFLQEYARQGAVVIGTLPQKVTTEEAAAMLRMAPSQIERLVANKVISPIQTDEAPKFLASDIIRVERDRIRSGAVLWSIDGEVFEED